MWTLMLGCRDYGDFSRVGLLTELFWCASIAVSFNVRLLVLQNAINTRDPTFL